jgi:hypothetical protein
MRQLLLILFLTATFLTAQSQFTDSFDSPRLENWINIGNTANVTIDSGTLMIDNNTDDTEVVHLIPTIGAVSGFEFTIVGSGTELRGDVIYLMNGAKHSIMLLFEDGQASVIYNDGTTQDEVLFSNTYDVQGENTVTLRVTNNTNSIDVEFVSDNQLVNSGTIQNPSEMLKFGQLGFACWGDVIDVNIESVDILYNPYQVDIPFTNNFDSENMNGTIVTGNNLVSSISDSKLNLNSIYDELPNEVYIIPPTGMVNNGYYEINGGGETGAGGVFRMNGSSYIVAYAEDDIMYIECVVDRETYYEYTEPFVFTFEDKSFILDLLEVGNDLVIEVTYGNDFNFQHTLTNPPAVLKTGAFGCAFWGDTIDVHINKAEVGNSNITNVVEEYISPTDYSLSQNYPNPFNPNTVIEYSIPESKFVSLIVYDMLGREVTVLVNENQQAGNYKVELNAENLSSGIYYYKISSGKYVETRKMILLK